MALRASREGLRKELVDYLGNLIINEKLQEDILKTINSFAKVDLLWTNANIEAEFVPQTISLDLSSYKYVIIRFDVGIFSGGYSGLHVFNLFFNSVSRTCSSCVNISTVANSNIIYREIMSISDSSIYFGHGKENAIDGVSNNNIMKPLMIYGVK